MEFIKMQACGNDYIYLDGVKFSDAELSKLSVKLSRRRFSVGADGIIAVYNRDGKISMKTFNSDGSEGAICGNGVRCSAVFAKRHLGALGSKITVKTKSRDVLVDLEKIDFPVAEIGEVNQLFTSIFLSDKLQKVGLYVDNRDIYSVNVGNLHLVVYTKNDLLALSEKVNKTNLFSDGVNIEKVYKIDESDVNNPKLSIEVFERGSGKTLSCGSGAVSVAYSYFLKKYGEVKEGIKVTVQTDGGSLFVQFKDGKAYLSGEIKQIYRGIIDEI